MPSDIEQLCHRARDGDESAASELIRLFYGTIFAFFRRLCGNEADAADLTQKSFCKVWSSIETFKGRSSFSTWIHSIAYHVFCDWRRKTNFSASVPDEWWHNKVDDGPSPFDTVSERDAANRVYVLVSRLDSPMQEVIHLHYYQGLSLKETAQTLGIATSTVKYRLREAMQFLKRHAEPDSQEHPDTSSKVELL